MTSPAVDLCVTSGPGAAALAPNPRLLQCQWAPHLQEPVGQPARVPPQWAHLLPKGGQGSGANANP